MDAKYCFNCERADCERRRGEREIRCTRFSRWVDVFHVCEEHRIKTDGEFWKKMLEARREIESAAANE